VEWRFLENKRADALTRLGGFHKTFWPWVMKDRRGGGGEEWEVHGRDRAVG